MKETYKADKYLSEKRLDLALVLLQEQLSRSQLRHQINLGVVKINGEVMFKPNYKVKEGDLIECNFDVNIVNSSPNIIPKNIPLEILYEDSSLLVINKPAGMPVHPATGNWDNTLMNAVTYYNNDLLKIGIPGRSGLIHRLDKDTSGVILIGKTNEAMWYYSKQFAQRQVEKTYIAVVKGKLESKSNIKIENYIGRHHINRKKFAVVEAQRGKQAITNLSVLDSRDDISVLEVKPYTGRTHQIRVHLANIGYPVIGDIIYARAKNNERLMLHAWKVKINLLDGETKVFVAKLPLEFEKYYKTNE